MGEVGWTALPLAGRVGVAIKGFPAAPPLQTHAEVDDLSHAPRSASTRAANPDCFCYFLGTEADTSGVGPSWKNFLTSSVLFKPSGEIVEGRL